MELRKETRYLVDMQSLSDVAAGEIRQHRQRRGITRSELAQKCASYGAPQLTYAALVNIETGRKGKDQKRRRDVTVDELAVLAKALGVPPLALLFPVGRLDEVPALPDRTAPTWDALRWFTGESAFPTPSTGSPTGWAVRSDDFADWEADRAGLSSYRSHAEYIKGWEKDRERAESARTPEARKRAESDMAKTAPVLWQERARLRGLGLKLPELPEDLRYIDGPDYQPDWGAITR
ncbi:helix-turn-helix domain-containing protein [Streptomyces radiopugnans]|nr:helix-turn-helix domain-containing protein [Streptomyces radiopugnans]